MKQKAQGGKVKRLTAKQRRMRDAVSFMHIYVAGYDAQAGYLDYSDETFIDDMLYGIGAALHESYKYAAGFDLFKQFLREHLKARAEMGRKDG